jgi:hypothetical protein
MCESNTRKNAAYQRTLEERCTRARHEEYHNKRCKEKRIHKKLRKNIRRSR